MLQSERLSKTLLTHSAVDSFSPQITTFSMGNVFERDLNVTNQPTKNSIQHHNSALCSSPKARRKRRFHSTGSSNCVDFKNVSPTAIHESVRPTLKSQSGLEASSHRTVTFSPAKRTQPAKSGLTSMGEKEGSFQSPNVVMIQQSELQNLKDLVLRHLDIVKEQQEVIAQKDQAIANLRMEKDTLKTRLDRMDRRLSRTPAAKKSSAPKTESTDCKPPTKAVANEPAQLDPTTSSTETPTTLTSTSVRNHHRHLKLKSPHKKRRLAQVTTQQTGDDGLLRLDTEYFSQQVHEYHELSERTIPTRNDIQAIEVPSFKLVTYSNLHSFDESEDISEQAYLKRHQRHENEERRRKRWDLQRLREAKMIEKLKQNKSQIAKTDSGSHVESIFPKAENALYLEVCDNLPVSVFGSAVSAVEATEFSLPWYKPPIASKGSKKKKRAKR